MQLTSTSEYAISILKYVAKDTDHLATVEGAAKACGMAIGNANRLITGLARAGLLVRETPAFGTQSDRLSLARPANDISLADILRVTEPGLSSIECFGPEELTTATNPEAFNQVIDEALAAYVLVMQRHKLSDLLASDKQTAEAQASETKPQIHDISQAF